jgi:DNA-binding CsgD family transcriptional regulator
MSIAAPVGESQVPTAASSSWRSWLMTGIRQGPIYRRRVRGAHKGLKRMLVEGMGEGVDPHGSWRGFSGAMVRQAVGEAVGSLPPRQRQLIKLAYFSDLSNREIAQGLGITLSSVERGLRQAIARISEQVERGRSAGRKVIYALAVFLGGRWLSQAHVATGMSTPQWVKAGTLVLATAAAGAMLAAHSASPAPRAHIDQASVPVVVSAPTDQVLPQQGGSMRHPTEIAAQPANVTVPSVPEVQVVPPAVAVPTVTLPVQITVPPLPVQVMVPPVTLPVHVKVPPLPVPSAVHGLLGA